MEREDPNAFSQRQTLMSQLVTDACDVWIPANNLGIVNLNEGAIGLLGSVHRPLTRHWS